MHTCKVMEKEGQCCCTCKFRITDYYHCTTVSKTERDAHSESHDRCICTKVKGYICALSLMVPEMNESPDGTVKNEPRLHSNWPEHSCGCEMWTLKDTVKYEMLNKKLETQAFSD